MATNLYSLLIQMDLSSSWQKWQNIAPFSKRNHVWSSNRVWNDRAFVVFLSLLSSATSFPLICSPSVELSLVSFCKASAWEGLRVEEKKLSSVRTRFLNGLNIFLKKSPLHASRHHARVSMSHVHQSVHSRPQRPHSFWSAPRIATKRRAASGDKNAERDESMKCFTDKERGKGCWENMTTRSTRFYWAKH